VLDLQNRNGAKFGGRWASICKVMRALGGGFGQQRQRHWPIKAELVLSIELHQKGENAMRKFLRQFIVRPKPFADRCLKGSETQICIPRVVFTAFCEIEPLLCHFEERRANPDIGGLLGYRQALGRKPSSFARSIARHCYPDSFAATYVSRRPTRSRARQLSPEAIHTPQRKTHRLYAAERTQTNVLI
jgi:hypothetical protein